METLRSQDVRSTRALVQQYLQNAESLGTGAEERSHLAQLCTECILLFRIILKTLATNNDFQSKQSKILGVSLKRSYGRLKIWSEEHGAGDGSLDATLAASRALQRDTLKYIVSIGQTLTDRLIKLLDVNLSGPGIESISAVRSLTAAVTEGNSDDSSDSGFSDSSSCTINGVLEDLRADTTCLLDLEPLLCSPIFRRDPEPTATLDSTHLTWRPYHSYCDKVSVRFPMAADDLVNTVGKANYERYLRCQEQKAKNELGNGPSDQTATGVSDNASTKFHDSGIGSSLHPTAPVYAETVMSYGMGEGRRVRVPPLTAQAKQGVPFVCVACGKWVKFATNSAWKKHVYGDLQPWICLEADCHLGTDTFQTRNDWVNHLALDHEMDPEWRVIECPLCRVEIGPGKPSVTAHMSEHLEEISLSALPVDCDFEEESEGSDPDREVDLNELLGGYGQVTEYNDWNSVCGEDGSDVHEVEEMAPKCSECSWRPDMTGNRSPAKLRQAVKQHYKRNHQSKDYACPFCNQSFRNRRDNVKPHVARKHPEMFAKLFPKTAQDGTISDEAIRGLVVDDEGQFPGEQKLTAPGVEASVPAAEKSTGKPGDDAPKAQGITHSRGGVAMPKSATSKRGRKQRREYPSSWGFDKGQMKMKKRVMAEFDGPSWLAEDDMPPKERLPFAEDENSVTGLDIQTIKRAEGLLNITEEEKRIWFPDDPTEEEIKAMLDAEMQ